MNARFLLLCSLVVFALTPSAPAHARATTLTHLRTEYLTNPLGIDAAQPRFFWVLESSLRGDVQTAYRVLVASSAANQARGIGDVWDSGKIASSENAQIAYAGPPLTSRTRYWLSVTAWNKGDVAAGAHGTFETGVLDPALWQAKWIGLAPASDDERLPLVGAEWLWAAVDLPAVKLPAPGSSAASAPVAATAAPKRIAFRHSVRLPDHGQDDGRIVRAELLVAAPGAGRPWEEGAAHDVWINGEAVAHWSGPVADVRHINVQKALHPGDNQITVASPYSPKAGFIAALIVDMSDGRRLVTLTDRTWRMRTFDSAKPDPAWRTQSDSAPPWTAVKVLGRFGADVRPGDPAYRGIDKLVPPALLRKGFTVTKPVASARLYATAAGIYEMQLNGKKIGRDFLTPGWTDYHKRIRYQTYDASQDVKPGFNILSATVADGWFSGRTGMGQNLWGFDNALFAELVLTYKDGTRQTIATDGSWRGTTGPWRRADLLDGELYDARRELPPVKQQADLAHDLDNDATWRPVVVRTPNVGPLEAQIEPPIRQVLTLPARAVTSPEAGVQIFDLGQNMVGWARVHFSAAAGATVKFRYAEMLNRDGTLFTENLRSAWATDRYIARGDAHETYEPRFTFHGFRYLEVSGHKGLLPLAAVTGVVVSSDLPGAGTFTTSNPALNQLQSNIVWGQRGNFLSIPTDCPQRDERLGWTGDINMFARTATFNADAAPFLAKYLIDLRDGQRNDGAFPDVAPTSPQMGAGAYGWADVGVFLPWLLYQTYGDRRVLEASFDSARRWVDLRTAHAKNDLNADSGFGDWVSPPPATPQAELSPMYHAQAAHVLAEMARVLGKADEASRYEQLADRIKVAFNKAFVAPDGTIKSDTQTAYVVALRYDMLPQALRASAGARLTAAIGRFNQHLNTGFLGTGNLLPALTLAGRNDLAYALLLTDTFPSWLYTVKNGATTMWERWDSFTPELGPSNKGDMNSYNHYAFGAVGEWLYAHVGGIDSDPARSAWTQVLVHPVIGGGLTHARADYQSIRGRAVADWALRGHNLSLDVVVPVHAHARVYIPAADPTAVRESGQPAAGRLQAAAPDSSDASDPHTAVFEIGSGTYHFASVVP